MKTVLGWFLFLCLSLPLYGQATYDASSSGHCDGGVSNVCAVSQTQLTISHTTGSGSNRAMAAVICVAGPSGNLEPLISTVVHAGSQSLSQTVHKLDGANNYYCDLWQLPAGTQPTSGTNNVVITLASGLVSSFELLNGFIVTSSGVDQATTFSITGSNAGAGTSSTLTLGASGANDLVFSGACAGSDFSSTAQTQRQIQSGAGSGACGSLIGSTAAGNTTSLSDTISASDSWIKIGAAFKAATGGVTLPPPRRIIRF